MKKKFILASNKIEQLLSELYIPSKEDEMNEIMMKIYMLMFSFISLPLFIIGAGSYITLYTIFAED